MQCWNHPCAAGFSPVPEPRPWCGFSWRYPPGEGGTLCPGTFGARQDFAPLPSPGEADGNLQQRPRAPEQTKPAVHRRRTGATPERTRLLLGGSSREALPGNPACARAVPSPGCRRAAPAAPSPKFSLAELRAPRRGGASPASSSRGGKACAETQPAQNRSHAWRCCSSDSYRN